MLGLVAGLAAVERKGFLQAMLSRPIALAPITGLCLGDVSGGLLVAAPLELFWLGAVNMGAALPVHEALGASAIAGGAVLAGRALATGVTPAVAVLAVLVSAPLALLGRKADRLVEKANERLNARAEAELRRGHDGSAVRSNLLGLALPFAIAFALAPAGAFAAAVLIPALLRAAPGARGPLTIGWFAFATLACASGARAMRARRAPALFFAAVAAGAVVGFAIGKGAP